MTLHLDDFPVELHDVGQPAHTTNDVGVWLPEQKVLFTGDLAFNGGQPFLLEGSIAGFRLAIAADAALAPEVLLPGHGPVCRGEEVDRLLPRRPRGYVDCIERRRRVVRRRADAARGGAEARRTTRTPDWAETERFVGNLHRAYAELDTPTTSRRRRSPSRRCGPTWSPSTAARSACHA